MERKFFTLLTVCSLSFLAGCYTASDVTATKDDFIVANGKQQAVIVGNDTFFRSHENGYRGRKNFLSSYLKESTGRTFKVISPKQYDPKTMPYAIFVNTPECRKRYGKTLKQLDRDSYVVSVTPNKVFLIGARRHSTGYAMADFLYRYMDIATYIPSRWGTIVPEHKTVKIPTGFHLEVPAFNSRAFSVVRTFAETGKKRLGYGSNVTIPWRMYRRDAFSHYIHMFIKAKEYGKTHPEYFPEINGKRIIVSTGTGPGPCISNPDVIKIVIRKSWEFFKKYPDRDSISLGMTDGGWCECAKCKSLDGPDITGNDKSKSKRYFWFLNQVAKELKKTNPNKYVGVLAYAGADYPPANMRLEPNIMVYICQNRQAWSDEKVRLENIAQFQAWAKDLDKVGTYEYLYGAGFMIPRIYNQYLAEFLRFSRAQLKESGFYAEIYSNHALDGPKAWIVEKLLWNPHQDPKKLCTKWCDVVFEEAAAPMNEYFNFLEECNSRNMALCPQVSPTGKSKGSKFYLLQDEMQFELFPPEDMKKARALLTKAAAMAKQGKIKERIKYFSNGFRVTELVSGNYHAYRELKKLGKQKNVSNKKLLAALIKGKAMAAKEDPITVMYEQTAKDASTFTPVMPVAITIATRVAEKIVNDIAWKAVKAQLKKGEFSKEKLIKAAKDAIIKIAPKGWQKDKTAALTMNMMMEMCERIATVEKVSSAPKIDGNTDDKQWKWQENTPWWSWKSGIPYYNKTQFAFCYKGNILYVAAKCYQKDLATFKRCPATYGAAAWKYLSVELHLNPDQPGVKWDKLHHYQVIPALGGGIYSKTHDVVKAWKVTEGKGFWQFEMALDLKKIRMMPDKYRALRMNMVRNIKEQGHYGKTWFPSEHRHANPSARGWLIFKK